MRGDIEIYLKKTNSKVPIQAIDIFGRNLQLGASIRITPRIAKIANTKKVFYVVFTIVEST